MSCLEVEIIKAVSDKWLCPGFRVLGWNYAQNYRLINEIKTSSNLF
jgi:hypothetical protein